MIRSALLPLLLAGCVTPGDLAHEGGEQLLDASGEAVDVASGYLCRLVRIEELQRFIRGDPARADAYDTLCARPSLRLQNLLRAPD